MASVSREEVGVSGGLVPAYAWVVIELLGFDLVPIIQWTMLGAAFWLLSKVLDVMWARTFQARKSDERRSLPQSPGKAQGRAYSTPKGPRSIPRA